MPESGDHTPDGRVHLIGPAMVSLVGVIPKVQALFNRPVVVGGLAVMSRLGKTYRATQDLDALRMRADGDISGLELLQAAGAKDVDEVGGFVPTERGDVRVDVLEARHNDLDRDFTDPTDRLEAMAHKWALDTATPVAIVATELDVERRREHQDEAVIEDARAVALVARAGPLVAMKLKASVDRTTVKEATDLLDVIRLMTDPATSGEVMAEFENVDPQLVEDVRVHAQLKFELHLLRTRRIIGDLVSAGAAELIDGAADLLDGMLNFR